MEQLQWFNNPRGRGPGGETIGIRKDNRVSFSSGFAKKNLGGKPKYCFLTAPVYDKAGFRVGFMFTDNEKQLEGITPYTISWGEKSSTGIIMPKTWFVQYNINAAESEGKYAPEEKSIPKVGKVYFIYVPKK
jgi:hypothetical protein